jgi:hypothetical protein
MSKMQRREFLGAAGLAVTTAALMRPGPAEAGDPSFLNNVPDPLLAGDELPTFKFELEKSKGKVIGNSYGKEATVDQLPISQGIAGVSMKRHSIENVGAQPCRVLIGFNTGHYQFRRKAPAFRRGDIRRLRHDDNRKRL